MKLEIKKFMKDTLPTKHIKISYEVFTYLKSNTKPSEELQLYVYGDEQPDGTILLNEVVVPDQKVSSVTTDEIANPEIELYKKRWFLQLHTHHNMGAFFSATDSSNVAESMDMLFGDRMGIFAVMNNSYDIYYEIHYKTTNGIVVEVDKTDPIKLTLTHEPMIIKRGVEDANITSYVKPKYQITNSTSWNRNFTAEDVDVAGEDVDPYNDYYDWGKDDTEV